MAPSISSLAVISTMFIVLVFLSSMARSDNHMPLFNSPFSGNICDEVNCGKGNCSADNSKLFGTLDYSCMPAPPPSPPKPNNSSLFDRAIGSDCSRLGVRLLNDSSSNGSPSGNSNEGIRFLPGSFHWIGMITIIRHSSTLLSLIIIVMKSTVEEETALLMLLNHLVLSASVILDGVELGKT
ncbi:hypothetical protein M8C21_010758, partial [Ambrosia artemisiifolia]